MRTPQLLLISNLANSNCSSVGAMTSGAPLAVVSPQFAPNVTGVALASKHFSRHPGMPPRLMAAGARLGATASSLHATAANVTAVMLNATTQRDILERLLSDVMTNSVQPNGWAIGLGSGWRRKDDVRTKGGDLEKLRRAIGPRVSICDLIPGRASRLRRWIRPLSSLESEERRDRQECDSARNSEREPRHPAELHSERYAPPPLDFGGAGIGRSTAETNGPVHELRTSRDRKPLVGTPLDKAEHCAPDVVVGVSERPTHERRTHGDLERS